MGQAEEADRGMTIYIFPSLLITGLNTVGLETDLESSLLPEGQNRVKVNIYVFL